MNKNELNCIELIKDLKNNHGMIGVKTSFEDEGALFNETIKLKNICSVTNTEMIIKVGGPEAIRDIKDSITLGTNGIVGPMVETKFALTKFINACETNIESDIIENIHLYVNLETITALSNINDFVVSENINKLNGVTIGRVDLVASMGLNRDFVDSFEILNLTSKTFSKIKELGLKCCLGGAVTIKSNPFLETLTNNNLLDKFETRYIMFDPNITLNNLNVALAKAQEFEYYWLLNKKQTYETLSKQDDVRIKMIYERLQQTK